MVQDPKLEYEAMSIGLQPGRVIVVEDDFDLRQGLTDFLRLNSFSVTAVGSGADLSGSLGYGELSTETRSLDAVLSRLRVKVREAGDELPVHVVHSAGFQFCGNQDRVAIEVNISNYSFREHFLPITFLTGNHELLGTDRIHGNWNRTSLKFEFRNR